MHLRVRPAHRLDLPVAGRQIVLWYDDETVAFYYSCDAATHAYALSSGILGDVLDHNDEIWLYPSLTQMLVRPVSPLLVIYLTRIGFDAMLRKAVLVPYTPDVHLSPSAWQMLLAGSWVRGRWQADYDLNGDPLARDNLSLGLRGKSARHFATGGWIHHIEDGQQLYALANHAMIPEARPYPLYDPDTARQLHVLIPS
jgi:hypothetical protein